MEVRSPRPKLTGGTSEEDQFDSHVHENLGACMRAYDDGRYVIDGGVDRARKQCKDRLFNGHSFSVFTIMS